MLAVNETKIDKNMHDDPVSIDGYTIKSCDRNRFGGGVAVYIFTKIPSLINVLSR